MVVGNVIAVGAGKTPLTLHLAERLKALGWQPGIVSRGYGGSVDGVEEVCGDTPASRVGDEPVLLRRRSGCPVFVGAARSAAGRALLAAYPGCNLILCDDGLQHYALQRDVEIAVLDRRGAMNGWPLPAGPLREPLSRLGRVDAVVQNGGEAPTVPLPNVHRMTLAGERFHRLDDPRLTCGATDLAGKRLHAVAGIGEPQRFFDHLAALGIVAEGHGFPDHHPYDPGELTFDGDAILTTEKDAVKFAALGPLPLPVWVLPVTAQIEPDLARFVSEKLHGPPPA